MFWKMVSSCSSTLVVILAISSGSAAREFNSQAQARPTWASTDHYARKTIEGWTVFANKDFLAKHHELANKALDLLRFQLYQVARRLPATAVDRLRKIAIWVEESEPNTPCMAYHPNVVWLREHGVNPDKAHCVEVANARNFLAWTLEQPWMLLHELAHGYHHRFLKGGFENAEIKAAYDHAMKSKLYDKVLRMNGRDEKAYATNNPMEYFAEATEAFFGTNDFYPFVRVELERHDPELFRLLKVLWERP
jgi:hypothetical protein